MFLKCGNKSTSTKDLVTFTSHTSRSPRTPSLKPDAELKFKYAPARLQLQMPSPIHDAPGNVNLMFSALARVRCTLFRKIEPRSLHRNTSTPIGSSRCSSMLPVAVQHNPPAPIVPWCVVKFLVLMQATNSYRNGSVRVCAVFDIELPLLLAPAKLAIVLHYYHYLKIIPNSFSVARLASSVLGYCRPVQNLHPSTGRRKHVPQVPSSIFHLVDCAFPHRPVCTRRSDVLPPHSCRL